jgi:hypothetical protein
MTRTALAAALALTLASPVSAMAQYTTTPNIYGQPQYGTTTTGPVGQRCETTPSVYGHPEYGMTTHCN